MRRACVLAVAIVCACRAAPTLAIDVTHPQAAAIATTVVSVYDSTAFGCQDVEYGDVDDTQLVAALVASETVEAGGATSGALVDLSRTDNKIVVARGYDTTGANITAGCVEKALVTGSDHVAVDTVVTATVSVGLADPTGTDFYGIAVTATDPSGALLDNRQVWWRVYGASGATPATTANIDVVTDGTWQPAQPSCSTNGGDVVHPVPPLLVGGFAIAVRVAWAVAPPPLFTAFTKADFSLTALAPPNNATKPCATQIASGVEHVACLDTITGAPSARLFAATVGGGAVALATTATQAVPSDAIAVYPVARGADQDVFVMTSHCAVAGLFGSTPTDPSQACAAGGGDDVLVAPACGSDPARVLVHVPGGAGRDAVKQVDPLGGALAPGDFPLAYRTGETAVELVAAGCVDELDPTGGPPTQRQVIAMTYTHAGGASPSTRISYACTASCQQIELPVPGGGVGFTGGSAPHMIAATVDATGVVMSQLVLVPSGATGQLVERSRVPSAGVPGIVAVGNFDSDPALDLLWNVDIRRGGTFEIAYTRLVQGQPLEALSQPQAIGVDTITVGDVTNDGYDDIAITGTDVLGRRGVSVIPTHVQAATVPPKSDSTCAP